MTKLRELLLEEDSIKKQVKYYKKENRWGGMLNPKDVIDLAKTKDYEVSDEDLKWAKENKTEKKKYKFVYFKRK